MTAPDKNVVAKPLHERCEQMAAFLGDGHIATLLREAAAELSRMRTALELISKMPDTCRAAEYAQGLAKAALNGPMRSDSRACAYCREREMSVCVVNPSKQCVCRPTEGSFCDGVESLQAENARLTSEVARLRTALTMFALCDLNEDNCASLAVATARIRNIANGALAKP